jgi:hypothetical protein
MCGENSLTCPDIDVLVVDFVFEDRRNFDHGRQSKGIADVFFDATTAQQRGRFYGAAANKNSLCFHVKGLRLPHGFDPPVSANTLQFLHAGVGQ